MLRAGLLLVHAEGSRRVFRALRQLKKPVALLTYPEGDHDTMGWTAAQRADFLTRVVAWFNAWLKPPLNSASPMIRALLPAIALVLAALPPARAAESLENRLIDAFATNLKTEPRLSSSRDGRYVLLRQTLGDGSGQLVRVDLVGGPSVKVPLPARLGDKPAGFALSPDGTKAAAASDDGKTYHVTAFDFAAHPPAPLWTQEVASAAWGDSVLVDDAGRFFAVPGARISLKAVPPPSAAPRLREIEVQTTAGGNGPALSDAGYLANLLAPMPPMPPVLGVHRFDASGERPIEPGRPAARLMGSLLWLPKSGRIISIASSSAPDARGLYAHQTVVVDPDGKTPPVAASVMIGNALTLAIDPDDRLRADRRADTLATDLFPAGPDGKLLTISTPETAADRTPEPQHGWFNSHLLRDLNPFGHFPAARSDRLLVTAHRGRLMLADLDAPAAGYVPVKADSKWHFLRALPLPGGDFVADAWNTQSSRSALFRVHGKTRAATALLEVPGQLFLLGAFGPHLLVQREDSTAPRRLERVTVSGDTASAVVVRDAPLAPVWGDEPAPGRKELVWWKNPWSDARLGGVLTLPDRPPAVGGKWPLVVIAYPQARREDGAARFDSDFANLPRLLALRGIATLEASLLVRPADAPDANYVKEFTAGLLAAADAAVAAHAGIDGNRLGVMGYSYGGYMVLSALVESGRFRAGVSGAGFLDPLLSYAGPGEQAIILGDTTGQGGLGGPPWSPAFVERYVRNSPLLRLDQIKGKVLLFVGGDDSRVPPEYSRQTFRMLRRAGKEATLVVYPEGGHGLNDWPAAQKADLLRRLLDFLDHTLQPTEAQSAGN